MKYMGWSWAEYCATPEHVLVAVAEHIEEEAAELNTGTS